MNIENSKGHEDFEALPMQHCF